MGSTNVTFKKSFKKAVGTMAMGEVISGSPFAIPYASSPINVKAANVSATKRTAFIFIKKTSQAYTEPKQNAKVFVLSGKKGAAIMENPEKAVRNQIVEATVHSRGYVEYVLNPELFDEDVNDTEFYLDHTPNKIREIEANVKSRGYVPHELHWDEEEVF